MCPNRDPDDGDRSGEHHRSAAHRGGVLVPATDGQAFSGQVASFKDTQGSGNPPSHYTATVDWGDGTTGAGTITANGSGGYDVAGAHTYGIGSVGTRTIGVTIHDVGGTDVVATSTASVACAAPPAPSAFPGPGPATTGTPDQRWITQVYRDVLGREPDQASLSFWSTTLEAVSRTTVAQAILSSAEYRNALIHALYQQLLHRPVDALGLSFWTTQLSNGITQEQFRAGLAGTQEYEANRGGGTNGGFLCAAYNDFLGRAIDPTALNSFLAALQSASATRVQVVQSILSSTEYRGDLITGFFGRYMHRGADPASLTFFLNLLSHGSTDEQVIAALLGSDEYFNRFAGGGSLIGRVQLRGTGLIAVNLLRPAHLGLLVVRVQGRRRIPLAVRPSVPRVHKLGIVDLGRHGKGKVRIRWDRSVKGRKLRPGRYTVTLLGLRANGRIADQSAPVTITVRR